MLAELLPRPKVFLRLFVLIGILEGLSFLGYLTPGWNHGVFIALTIVAGILAVVRFEMLVSLALIEMIISPKGYMFSLVLGGHVISLRHMLFLALLLGWGMTIARTRRVAFFQSSLVWATLAFCLTIAAGVSIGWRSQPHHLVFADANAYLTILFIPIFFGVLRNRKRLHAMLKLMVQGVVIQGVISLAIAIIFSAFIYSPLLARATAVDEAQLARLSELATVPENAELAQTVTLAPGQLQFRPDEQQQNKPLLYRWLRDSGQAEVTYLGGRVFRVFTASSWFAVPLLLILLAAVIRETDRRRMLQGAGWLAALALIILLSYSRSFWLASSVGVLLVFALSPPHARRTFLLGAGVFVAVILILGITLSPVRHVAQERISSTFHPKQDVATLDRVNLLDAIKNRFTEHPWRGSGFGAHVTYPVLVPGTTLVEYIQVYLFEWTYLDLAVKVGLIGVGVILLFLGQLGVIFAGAMSRFGNHDALPAGALAAWAAFLTVNITTPYLNHPLGFCTLAIFVGMTGALARQRGPWHA